MEGGKIFLKSFSVCSVACWRASGLPVMNPSLETYTHPWKAFTELRDAISRPWCDNSIANLSAIKSSGKMGTNCLSYEHSDTDAI